MSTLRHPARGLLALLAVPDLLLAACSSGSDHSSPDETGGEGTDTTAEADQSEVDPDGVLKVGYDLLASNRGGFTWDPAEVSAAITDAGLYQWVYGSLFRLTNDGEFEPDLAESATVVNPETIEIVLRPDLTFADGAPFDAEAVTYGL